MSEERAMNNYVKEQIIGRGAYGTVFLCSDKSRHDRQCILKEIPMEQVPPEERSAALNEVQILKVLNHPNIVRYIDSALESRALLIVMEYVAGGTLYDYLQRQNSPLSENTVLSFFVQITVALSHIHSKNVLHRDLKTQNLLIDRQARVIKISDFGISKVLSSKSKAMTVVGTPCYISPEVCDHRPYNQKSDIWAVGCILYELCTLKRAFEAPSLPALVMKIMRANYAPPPPIYSHNLRNIISKCLSLEPHRRPNTSQLLCDPMLFKTMQMLYADIGVYQPISNSKRPKVGPMDIATMSKTRISNGISRVYLWGDGHLTPSELPVPGNVGNISSVFVGGGVRVAVTDQDILIVWDASVSTDGLPMYTPRRIGESKFRHVATGQAFIAAITDRGVLVIARAPDFELEIVESLLGMDCTQVASGPRHLIALTKEGEIWLVFKEKISDIQSAKQLRPELCHVPSNYRPEKIFAGPLASAAITKEGKLLTQGRNFENRLMIDRGSTKVSQIEHFTEVSLDFPVESIAIGESHSALISKRGDLYLIGTNKHGALGDSFTKPRTMALRKLQSPVMQVSVGLHYTCALCLNGSIWTWGRPIRGQLGRNPEPQDHPRPVNMSDQSAISISTNEGITLVSVKSN